jgi:hypothetical protein
MRYFILGLSILLAQMGIAAEHSLSGSVLLRYENEYSHTNFSDRERIRTISRLALSSKFNQTWSTQVSIRTGLKNKQNVPAITLYKFTDQPQPPNDIFIDRLFVKGQFARSSITFGKIPWLTKQNTDMFWDRHLNPIGAHYEMKLSNTSQFSVAHLLPLDGNSSTIGQMSIVQYRTHINVANWKWDIQPWFVNYQGQDGAEFARNDTQYDHTSVRLATSLSKGNWRIGLDVGHTLSNFDSNQVGDFSDDKNAFALGLRWGNIKKVGHIQAHLRYLRVERFGVIREFAQNATSRFVTANFKGIDFRLRKKMGKNWWLGTRVSRVEALRGEVNKGTRFRIEGQYKF